MLRGVPRVIECVRPAQSCDGTCGPLFGALLVSQRRAEPEPRSLSNRLCREERFDDLRQDVGRVDRYDHVFARRQILRRCLEGTILRKHADSPTRRHRIACVENKVHHARHRHVPALPSRRSANRSVSTPKTGATNPFLVSPGDAALLLRSPKPTQADVACEGLRPTYS